jgi:diguanylate cyclase (GGDEF)-like protein
MDERDSPQHGTQETAFEKPAFVDPLTGLFNRYYLNQFLPEEIRKSSLNNYPLSLLMIDLDGFKKVNDTHGHLCGDRVLAQLAKILKKAARTTDTVIRYAGDEFIVLLPGVGAEKLNDICGRMLSDVRGTAFEGDKGQKLKLTLSIGSAIYPEDARDQTRLIGSADKALYLAKKRGRDTHASAKEVTVEEVSALAAMDAFPCPAFIDKTQELSILKQAADKALGSRATQAAFISGPSGTGKSRLLSELNNCFRDKVSLIYANAASPRTQEPYYLFIRGISAYMEKMGADNPVLTDILLKMPLPESAELGLVIPQVRNMIKGGGEAAPADKQHRFMLFKAFLDFIGELSAISPVFIAFDDIQWVDKASLELVRYLILREKNRNIFIACSYLKETQGRDLGQDNLSALLKEVAQVENVTRVELSNLSPEDAARMIEAIFPGTGKNGEFGALVYNATKGNPSFIEETLKFLVEAGYIFYQGNSWQVKKGLNAGDIPSSIDDIVKKRVKNLDEETKEMIIQAAVIGEDFHVDVLKTIGNKEDGFIADLVNRAKKMRIIDELGSGGRFSFINKNIKDVLYNEISQDERNRIHYKVAQALEEGHKGNIYNVAGEAAFHYSRAPQEAAAAKASQQLLRKTYELFDAGELNEYIGQLAEDILSRREKVVSPLSDAGFKAAIKFVVFLQGAVRKFRLYPVNSSVRVATAKELYPYLVKLYAEVANFIITEVEKSIVLNGKRPSPSEIEYTNAEFLISIMVEHNIKTISLKRGMREEELSKFIHYLSCSRQDVSSAGGWAVVINKEGMDHLGIDEVRFTSVDEYAARSEEKKKLQDIMLMEFLMGKVDDRGINHAEVISSVEQKPQEVAEALMELSRNAQASGAGQPAAEVVTNALKKLDAQVLSQDASGASHAEGLAKVIMQLEPVLRNKVMRSLPAIFGREQRKLSDDILRSLPEEMVMDLAMEEYQSGNALSLRDFLDSLLGEGEKRRQVISGLEERLSACGAQREDIEFISGRKAWEGLGMRRRLEIILGLPKDKLTPSALEKVKKALDELESGGEKEELKKALDALLAKTKELEGKSLQGLMLLVADFIKGEFTTPEREDYLKVAARTTYVLEKLQKEDDPAVFGQALFLARQIIDKLVAGLSARPGTEAESESPAAKRYYLFVDNLLCELLNRYRQQAKENPQACALIKQFILDIATTGFLEVLIYRIADNMTKNKYNIRDMYAIIGDRLIDTLVGLATTKNLNLKDPFSEFVAKKRIATLLTDLKDVSLEKIKRIVADNSHQAPVPLIKFVGYLKDEELATAIFPYLKDGDAFIRRTVITALGDIGGDRVRVALAEAAQSDPDAELKELAEAKLQRMKKPQKGA